jgi:hypothetical protein
VACKRDQRSRHRLGIVGIARQMVSLHHLAASLLHRDRPRRTPPCSPAPPAATAHDEKPSEAEAALQRDTHRA